MSQSLYILVATGQKIANLPPVLATATGGDRYLWLVSDRGREQHLTAGCDTILRDHGLVPIGLELSIGSGRNLHQLQTQLMGCLRKLNLNDIETIYYVANGGQKLVPVAVLTGLYSVITDSSPKIRVLYGNDRPVGYYSYQRDLSEPIIQPYKKSGLTLAEVLALQNYEEKSDQKGKKSKAVWRDGALTAAGRKLLDSNNDFGPKQCKATHDRYTVWHALQKDDLKTITFKDIIALVRQDTSLADRWQKVRAYFEEHWFQILAWVTGEARTPQSESAAAALHKKILYAFADTVNSSQPPAKKLGPSFEKAVACRLLRFLSNPEQSDLCKLIVDIRTNVHLGPIGGEQSAEWDVALLLKNGIVLSLECKTTAGAGYAKDIRSRLLEEQNASSRLARMAIVAPLFTNYQDEDWFNHQLDVCRVSQEINGIHMIYFDEPGQPRTINLARKKSEYTVTCQPFEEGVRQWLAPFVPQ